MGKLIPSASPSNSAFDPLPSADTIEGRILRAGRQHLFAFGYSSFTMDDLSHELGMSKKTLYVHFPSKEAIVGKIIDCMVAALRLRLDGITTDPKIPFVPKLAAMIEAIGTAFAPASPHMLRDLERFAPEIYRKIEAIRAENIPLYFGRLIRQGIDSGKVRPEIDADFATQFWLHAMRGLVQPAALERVHLTPTQTLEKATDLFFGGLLTLAGRTDYETPTVKKKRRRSSK